MIPLVRVQVRRSFNETVADYRLATLIHELLREQAALNPDALAVLDERQYLS
jgi:non-ribosomal peptide synthetase component F